MGIPMEFGATPLTQIRSGSTALFLNVSQSQMFLTSQLTITMSLTAMVGTPMQQGVMQHTTVREVIHLASAILEG